MVKSLIFSTLLTAITLLAANLSTLKTVRINTPNGQVTFKGNDDFQDKKIIGENNLVPVNADGTNIPFEYLRYLDAFGKTTQGCTATHIGKGIVLTAGHCLDAPSFEGTNIDCEETKIEWGLRDDLEPKLTSKCVKILSMSENIDLDYAILKVDPAPKAYVDIELSKRPEIDTEVTIFGHPMARPLEWSGTCLVKESSNSEHAGEYEFCHQCDTEAGNSGSTIIDTKTFKVIGIHNGGVDPWNYATYLVDIPLKQFIEE